MRKKKFIHFIPREELQDILNESQTIAEVLRRLNMGVSPGEYKFVRQRIENDSLDISHWTSPNKRPRPKSKKYHMSLDTILVKNCTHSRSHVKRRLIKEKLLYDICYKCGQLPFWKEEKLVMVLDHINGINDDYRLENLQMLCPNCNSQQPTFSGRNNTTKEVAT